MSDAGSCGGEFAAVVAILRKLCKAPSLEVAPETRLDELPGMDSLRVLHAIAMMEMQFEVQMDAGALEGISRVQDIVSAIAAAPRATSEGATHRDDAPTPRGAGA